MLTPFLQHALRENRQLFAMMHSFNYHPALHIHPNRFEFLPSEVWRLLRKSRRGERWLSSWARITWELPDDPFWEFSDPRFRLALLPLQQMSELLKYAGAAVHSHTISRTIDRNSKTQFKSALGEAAYHFALKRAPLISRGFPQELLPSPAADHPAEQQLRDAGRFCLAVCVADGAPKLQRRLELKVDGDLPLAIAAKVDEDSRQRVWKMVQKILFTEVAPELKPCFN